MLLSHEKPGVLQNRRFPVSKAYPDPTNNPRLKTWPLLLSPVLFPTCWSCAVFPVWPSQLLSPFHSFGHSLVTTLHWGLYKSLLTAGLFFAQVRGPDLVLLWLTPSLQKDTAELRDMPPGVQALTFTPLPEYYYSDQIVVSLLPETAGFLPGSILPAVTVRPLHLG